jgi:hypothetical protein
LIQIFKTAMPSQDSDLIFQQGMLVGIDQL